MSATLAERAARVILDQQAEAALRRYLPIVSGVGENLTAGVEGVNRLTRTVKGSSQIRQRHAHHAGTIATTIRNIDRYRAALAELEAALRGE